MSDEIRSFRKLKTLSMPELVAKDIQSKIFDGVFKSGDKLPTEAELSKKYDVNRGTIRQALLMLESKRIIKTVHGSGTYVQNTDLTLNPNLLLFQKELGCSFDPEIIKSSLDFRRLLEIYIINKAALQGGSSLIKKLNEITKMQEERLESSASEFAKLDISFHIELAKSVNNTLLLGTLNDLFAFTFERRTKFYESKSNRIQALEHHNDLIKFIEAKDLSKALACMDKHLLLAEKAWNTHK